MTSSGIETENVTACSQVLAIIHVDGMETLQIALKAYSVDWIHLAQMTVDNEFELLPRNLLGGTEEHHEDPHSE
jgi:hypothetical protein